MNGKYASDIALPKDAIYDMQQLLKDPESLAQIAKFSIQEAA
jgi:hypothetical protein